MSAIDAVARYGAAVVAGDMAALAAVLISEDQGAEDRFWG